MDRYEQQRQAREDQEAKAQGILDAVFALATGKASLIIDKDGDRTTISVQHPPS